MQHSIEKFLFFFLLGFFLFSFPVYLSASETGHSTILTSQVGAGHLIERASSGQSNHQTSTTVTFQSRSELYWVFFGIFMMIIGLVAVALALYRWKPNDLSLISFGVFCFIYGARSSAIQFLVDAPQYFGRIGDGFLATSHLSRFGFFLSNLSARAGNHQSEGSGRCRLFP